MKSTLNWFEIPVQDMARAKTFYGTILDAKLEDYPMPDGHKMAVLPYDGGSDGGVGGALMEGANYTPSHDGALVYLNGGDDLQVVQNRVAPAGGKVLQEKMSIGENGFVAVFQDSEGNKVGLHSMA